MREKVGEASSSCSLHGWNKSRNRKSPCACFHNQGGQAAAQGAETYGKNRLPSGCWIGLLEWDPGVNNGFTPVCRAREEKRLRRERRGYGRSCRGEHVNMDSLAALSQLGYSRPLVAEALKQVSLPPP